MPEMPERVKGVGAQTFQERRSAMSKQIILEQILDVSQKFYKDNLMEFDEDDCNWVVFDGFYLPPKWIGVARTSPLLISFPMEYPSLPPIGFYLSSDIPVSPNGHKYNFTAHGADPAPLSKHWHWYCVYIEAGNWRPSVYRRKGDWRSGDNLWDYITLIKETLQSDD